MATLEEIARQVIAGQYGSGADRRTNLTNAGYDYNTVQSAVNTLMGGGTLANGGTSIGTTASSTPAVSTDPTQGYRNNISSLTEQINKLNNGTYTSKYTNQMNDISNQIYNLQNATYNDTYANQIGDLTNKITNFTYDKDNDEAYQQYAKEYDRAGRQAYENTLGDIASRTGGYASSYAYSSAEQAYNAYMQQLANKIPELRQLALDTLNNNLSTLKGLRDDDYNKWDNNRNYNVNLLNNQLSALQSQDNLEFNQWKDSRDTEESRLRNNLSMYQSLLNDALSEQMEREKMAISASKASSGGSGENDGGITPTQTSRTKQFESSIMTRTEWGRHKSSYKTYEDYVDSVIDKWNNQNRWTDGEMTYLIRQFGL